MSEDSIISLKNVNKWFGDFHVLKDVDLEVKKKERIVVCGPSGSGKSTLIRCINRLEEHQEGTIIVDGIDEKNNLSHLRCHKIELKKNHNDNGNTPRSIGTNYAINRNFDFIMYLDADNWFLNNHVNSLLNLTKEEVLIACSYRSFYTVDEKKMSYLEDDDCLNKKFVDTSCYLIPRKFFKLIFTYLLFEL